MDHCFLLPGGGNAPLVQAFASKAVCCLHEHTCTVAAEAYAQVKGLGLALVTTGPGVTNSLTGLAAAWLDSTPLMLLSGQVKREYMACKGERQRGFQELPNEKLTEPITKWRKTQHTSSEMSFYVRQALAAATCPRKGPVHLDVPLDVQVTEAAEEIHVTFTNSRVAWQSRTLAVTNPAAEAALYVAEFLRKAEKPVLLLGNGARCSEVQELVEAVGLPTLLTWRAADILEEQHQLFCGRPGIAGTRGANFIQQAADVLVCVGARLDIGQVGYDSSLFAPQAKKVVVDIDKAEAKKYATSDCSAHANDWEYAVCDGPSFLRELAKLRSRFTQGASPWLTICRQTYLQYRLNHAFYDALWDAALPSDVIVAGSSGAASEATLQHVRIKQGQRLVFSPGLGSMGFGLPAAIGVYFATRRRVICVEGDGSFAMNAYELETIRRLNLPIKVFVLRNGGYASIKRTQSNARYTKCVPSVPDSLMLAQALGVPTSQSGSKDAMVAAMAVDGPALFVVDIPCELACRMRTIPPGKPEEMLPLLQEKMQTLRDQIPARD